MTMATIDYKEKYEQALEVAKRFYNNCVAITKKGLEDIFPELKESEDERIRNLLYCLIRDRSDNWKLLEHNGVSVDMALAWLEKQKHNKFIVEDAYQRGYGKGVKDTLENQSENQKEHNICDTCNYNGSCIIPCHDKLIGKQGEQKYNESDDERIRKHLIMHFGNKSKTAWNGMPVDKIIAWLERQGEKSAGWSKEDEDNLNSCLAKLEIDIQRWGNHGKTMVDGDEKLINWLKFLKERVQPQPKQEWSERDKHILKNIYDFVAENLLDKNRGVCADECLKWLNLLKDRVQSQNTITDEELAQAKKDAYNDALNKIEYHIGEPTFDDGWSAVIWYMKKRNAQLQSTWKPSDEQMTILNEVLNFAANHESLHWNDYIFGTLNNLIRQLKKLMEE